MALPQNRLAIMEILNQITPRIIGKAKEIVHESSDYHLCQHATAIDIIPAGDEYPGQEIFWYLWSVVLTCEFQHETCTFHLKLSDFLAEKEIEDLFDTFFPDADPLDRPYEPVIETEERLDQRLRPAVRIKDNKYSTVFYIDWGKSQLAASLVEIVYKYGPSKIMQNSLLFWILLGILRTINSEVYKGGPEPVLLHESFWLPYYVPALENCQKAKHLTIHRVMRGTHLGIYDSHVSFVK